jgi:hypothetical protein
MKFCIEDLNSNVVRILKCGYNLSKLSGNVYEDLRTFLAAILNAQSSTTTFRVQFIGKGKGKAVPLQAWSGPEGSRKLSFPDFLTTAQDGGKVVSHTHRPHLYY